MQTGLLSYRVLPAQGFPMGSMLPPKKFSGKRVPISVTLPTDLVERLDEIAETTGYSRAEVVYNFLVHSLEQYEAGTENRPKNQPK